MMLAAIMLLVITVLGVGIKVLGARPMLHFMRPPIQVWFGMVFSVLSVARAL